MMLRFSNRVGVLKVILAFVVVAHPTFSQISGCDDVKCPSQYSTSGPITCRYPKDGIGVTSFEIYQRRAINMDNPWGLERLSGWLRPDLEDIFEDLPFTSTTEPRAQQWQLSRLLFPFLERHDRLASIKRI